MNKKAIDKNIYNNAINEKNWGNAKRFTMAAMEKGIELDNTTELYAFADEYNKNIEKNLKSEDKIDKRDFILECIYSKY